MNITQSAALLLLRLVSLAGNVQLDFGLNDIALLDSGRLNRKTPTSLSILITPF
jgi:hypothetical protein